MTRFLAALAILGVSHAAVAEMTCRVDADVIVSVRDDGKVVEVRRDAFPSDLTIVEGADHILVDGDRCSRVAEGRFRCTKRHDMVEVAILGTRVRILSADLGGVSGETGFLLLSGTCESPK